MEGDIAHDPLVTKKLEGFLFHMVSEYRLWVLSFCYKVRDCDGKKTAVGRNIDGQDRFSIASRCNKGAERQAVLYNGLVKSIMDGRHTQPHGDENQAFRQAARLALIGQQP